MELSIIDERLKTIEEAAILYNSYEEILQCPEITQFEQMQETRD